MKFKFNNVYESSINLNILKYNDLNRVEFENEYYIRNFYCVSGINYEYFNTIGFKIPKITRIIRNLELDDFCKKIKKF
jgi:hypothetical protein